ncbi:unnamed protein product [Dovyalis caffra]|uniref:Uncharacterized protein n=1 Tax=Dovyalis caffra TaxID=77055 RepID=A0AAV1RZ73_9ROSI|nr:unnamed protein product [Dovyalis caffra]
MECFKEDTGYAFLHEEDFSDHLASSPPIDFDFGFLNNDTAVDDSNQTNIGPSLSMPQKDQPALDAFSDFCELNQIPTSPPMLDMSDSFEDDPSPDDFLDIGNLLSESDIEEIGKGLFDKTKIGANELKIETGGDESSQVSKKRIHQIDDTRSIDDRRKMNEEERRLRRERSERALSRQAGSAYVGVIRFI